MLKTLLTSTTMLGVGVAAFIAGSHSTARAQQETAPIVDNFTVEMSPTQPPTKSPVPRTYTLEEQDPAKLIEGWKTIHSNLPSADECVKAIPVHRFRCVQEGL
jgi:hypothetical protein